VKKSLRLLAAASVCWLAPATASAQYYIVPFFNAGTNPGGFNTDQEVPAGQLSGWSTLLTGTALTVNAPVWTPMQTLPFAFQFNGQPVRRFRVASTGVLTFDSTVVAAPPVNNTGLPAAAIPDGSVCIWGLTTGANDFIVTKTFGTAPYRQFWVQFNSASQTGSTGIATYWSIVLQETSNTIFLVDQRTSGGNLTFTLGVQRTATQANQVNGSPNVNSRTTTTSSPSPSDNTYYMVEPGTQPTGDMTIRAVTLPSIQGANIAIPIVGSVRNLGSQAVTSYQLGYSVNGGPAQIDAITGVNIGALGTSAFTHTVPFTPTAGGSYRLKVWATQPNGQPDLKAFNDTTTRVIQVADSSVQRTVVMESFTSSTCPPCAPGNVNIRTVQRANPGKAIKIAYQQNFPAPGNDPYYTLEGGARFNYYNGSFVPYMLLDGGWGDNSNSLTSGILNQYYNQPAFVKMVGRMTRTGNTIDVTATITPYLNLDPGTVAHVIITEKHTRNNRRTNGETDFYDVMKKMLPNESGTVLPALASRQPYTLTQTYTFPAGNNVESFDSLQVAVFLQSPATKQVLNGMRFVQRPLSVADEAQFGPLAVAPNPATAGTAHLCLTLPTAQLLSAEVVDALGRTVATVPAKLQAAGYYELPLTLPSTAAGLYLVRVKTGDTVRTRRLVIN
jgi:hypothetical protein